MWWNLFLAVFSFCGAVRTVPHTLLLITMTLGWSGTLCHPANVNFGSGVVGLWTCLFVYSKLFELLDTLFLVLRAKEVSLLHWYHHFSVLLYCWSATMYETPSGIIFCAMNYSVHAIMYYYYYLMARRSV